MENNAHSVKGLMLLLKFMDIQEETPAISRVHRVETVWVNERDPLENLFGNLKIRGLILVQYHPLFWLERRPALGSVSSQGQKFSPFLYCPMTVHSFIHNGIFHLKVSGLKPPGKVWVCMCVSEHVCVCVVCMEREEHGGQPKEEETCRETRSREGRGS